MSSLDRESAIKLLRVNNVQQNVIEHCLTVSDFAVEIAKEIKKNGRDIDVGFVETAALLHDLGRCKTHGIMHGVEGAKILKDYPEYARVCECHIGGGITREEAKTLGLPPRDYIPRTLEEKVICYADKLISGTSKVTLEATLKKYRERLGAGHKTMERIKSLDEEIRGLAGTHT